MEDNLGAFELNTEEVVPEEVMGDEQEEKVIELDEDFEDDDYDRIVIEEKPIVVNEPVIEVEEPKSVEAKDEFVVRIGDKYLIRLDPFVLTDNKFAATIYTNDWARNAIASIKMTKRTIGLIEQV